MWPGGPPSRKAAGKEDAVEQSEGSKPAKSALRGQAYHTTSFSSDNRELTDRTAPIGQKIMKKSRN